MAILVFEDALVNQLAPITLARSAWCVSVGSFRLIDLLRETGERLHGVARSYLHALLTSDCSDVSLVVGDDLPDGPGPTLVLNARLVPSASNLAAVRRLISSASAGSGVVWDGDQVAAVVNPGWTWDSISRSDGSMEALLLSIGDLPRLDETMPLMSYPHEVIAAHVDVMGQNLEHRTATGSYEQRSDGVFLAEGAKLGPYVLTDTSDGPIIIEQNASVGPYTLLTGPIHIGANTRILEHAAIKDAVALGHTTKIGGEVEASIVEPYTNKQHHGFLGHSYLGSWINLGAGTCNSDLKNTYGKVNMEYRHGKSATGMQFLGCVMGDYSKTAINTGIFTGKVIGVCSMMYGFVTSNVPSYVNYARLFGQMTTLPPDIMIATQQRMFSRRKVEQRACDMQLLHDMFRLTQHERDRFGDAQGF